MFLLSKVFYWSSHWVVVSWRGVRDRFRVHIERCSEISVQCGQWRVQTFVSLRFDKRPALVYAAGRVQWVGVNQYFEVFTNWVHLKVCALTSITMDQRREIRSERTVRQTSSLSIRGNNNNNNHWWLLRSSHCPRLSVSSVLWTLCWVYSPEDSVTSVHFK